MVRMAIILVHNGLLDPNTTTILKKLSKYKIEHQNIIIKIPADEIPKNWLESNERNVKIESFPVFLVATDEKTDKYLASEIETVMSIIEDLL